MVSENAFDSQVDIGSIPQQKLLEDGRLFPFVLQQRSPVDISSWASANKDRLKMLLKDQGAIMFRGFPMETPSDLQCLAEALDVEPLPYVGGAAPRITIYKDVHTTNESPPEKLIPFHHEMAQVPTYPQTLFFFCQQPPMEGGETPLLLSDVIYSRIAEHYPQFVSDLEEKGIVYTRVIPKHDDPDSPIGRGWINTFNTDDKQVAEKAADKLNVTLEWLEDGNVRTISPVLPAVKTIGKLGKKVWFNSLIAAYVGWEDSRNDRRRAVTFGDGTLLDEEIIKGCMALMQESCVAVPWQKGDVFWIDNNQCMHSRNAFKPPRRILAFLGKNCVY